MDGPLVAISDWPDFAMRAVLLDLNPYGRVPKMDTLLGIIDVLSLLKINQFHTFFRVGSTDASYLCYCKRWDYIYLLILCLLGPKYHYNIFTKWIWAKEIRAHTHFGPNTTWASN